MIIKEREREIETRFRFPFSDFFSSLSFEGCNAMLVEIYVLGSSQKQPRPSLYFGITDVIKPRLLNLDKIS